jgi:RimJ/RimL family protein N-acetyltransferase
MRHEIRLDGHGYGLRPIDLDDADLIVTLRGDVDRARYLHRVELTVDAQRAWLAAYLERPDDYYFVVERLDRYGGGAEGLVSVYNFDGSGDAEWGRWITRRGSLAAAESVWLVCRVAFEWLGLERVHSRTLTVNGSVLSFLDRAGMARAGEGLMEGFEETAVTHVVDRHGWSAVAEYLELRARRVAGSLQAA